MPQDDSFLYSGMTSASRSKQIRQTVNRSNVEKKQVLRPYAQVVFDELEKLKAEALDLKTFILEGQTKTDVKLELAVRKRTYLNLVKLQSRFNMILKSELKEAQDETDV